MQHFKDPKNKLHFIEPEFAQMLPNGSVQISEAEAEAMRPKPSAAEIRRMQITARLAKIDTDSARPARAVAVALARSVTPDTFDLEKLQSLEAQAAALRAELKTL